ncbi:MAG: flagellar biosynthesis protein FliQ [Spirochaetales bacterium]|nr:flagellar biosynthesis protein FliQ [Spirochaetales bacterium]
MDFGILVNLIQSGILQILLIASPMLLVGLAVGLIISVFQATTSIQEQTLTFVPKIAAILGSIIVFGPWIFSSMAQFTIKIIQAIPTLAK